MVVYRVPFQEQVKWLGYLESKASYDIISHENKPYDELEERSGVLNGVTAAYDGLEIEVCGA